MTKAVVKWVVEDFSEEDTQPLCQALEAEGYQYALISSKDVLLSKFEGIFADDACVVFIGSLYACKSVRKKSKWIPGAYYDVPKYECCGYYPSIGGLLLNKDYIMLPFGDLKRRKHYLYSNFGNNDSLFIRPNRGDKPFNGCVLDSKEFDEDVQYLGNGIVDSSELVVAARPINILAEWRFICVEGEVIAGSIYKNNSPLCLTNKYQPALEFANDVAKLYAPERVYAVDVCLTKTYEWAVMEIGAFSPAGLYGCDRNVIIRNVSEVALKEWEEYNC